jgi:hypothetical protein
MTLHTEMLHGYTGVQSENRKTGSRCGDNIKRNPKKTGRWTEFIWVGVKTGTR